MQIDLTGWTLVHTWHESHGNGTQETYQREPTGNHFLDQKPTLLVVCRAKNGSVGNVYTSDRYDYLKARTIRANPDRYVQGAHSTEPCCTAGSDDFEDKETGDVWRIFGAAGHGEWAFKL